MLLLYKLCVCLFCDCMYFFAMSVLWAALLELKWYGIVISLNVFIIIIMLVYYAMTNRNAVQLCKCLYTMHCGHIMQVRWANLDQ